MDLEALLLAAAAGAASVAAGAGLLALVRGRSSQADDEAGGAIAQADEALTAAQASVEAFDIALVKLGDGPARLAAGAEALAVCADILGAEPEPEAVVEALIRGG